MLSTGRSAVQLTKGQPNLIQPARSQLIEIKRLLIAARIHAQEAEAKARRTDNRDLAVRLYDITDMLANELDYVEMLLSKRR
jgi:hypothetical protein